MLERFLHNEGPLAASWNELGIGAPTIIALAQLCSQALSHGQTEADSLSDEARAILYAARERGVLEVKANNTAYESPCRMLTVHVEVQDDQQIRFRDPGSVRQNVLFLEGFRELCRGGLVMHHLYHEFSLTAAGFQAAASLSPAGLEPLLQWAQPCAGE